MFSGIIRVIEKENEKKTKIMDNPISSLFSEQEPVSCWVGEVAKILCLKIEWIKSLTKRVELDKIGKLKSSQKIPYKTNQYSS